MLLGRGIDIEVDGGRVGEGVREGESGLAGREDGIETFFTVTSF